MNRDSLETKASVQSRRSIIRTLVDDAGWLFLHSEVQYSNDLPQAQRCRMRFEQMNLRTRYIIYKELKVEAEKAFNQGNLDAAKLYNERATYLWENYIVVFRRI